MPKSLPSTPGIPVPWKCRLAEPRTHYQVLGVAPLASADELKVAFRNKARELHPDNNANKSTAQQHAASLELARLTESWRVLNDPRRRLDYDQQQLARQRRPAIAVPTIRPHSGSGSSATRPTPQSVGITYEPSSAKPIVWIIGILAVVAVVVILFVGGSEGDSSTPSPRIQVGACVLVVSTSSGKTLHPVPCSDKHDGIIAQQLTDYGPCRDTEESFNVAGVTGRICVKS